VIFSVVEKGAFTDAKTSKAGILELAHTGAIFPGEMGDMSLSLQPKFFRALESKTIRRVGGSKDISIDVRVISATNQDLKRKIQDNSFRSDLFYRLNALTINLPSLRRQGVHATQRPQKNAAAGAPESGPGGDPRRNPFDNPLGWC